jgi:hypothetical protein
MKGVKRLLIFSLLLALCLQTNFPAQGEEQIENVKLSQGWVVQESIKAPDNLVIWKEFVDLLKSGQLTQDRIKPHEFISKETQLRFLGNLKKASDRASSWGEWEAEPEVFPVENQVHFLIPLGFGGEKKTVYCFTFLKEENTWYYRHMENISIRLDKTPLPPTSDFPDLPEETKAWQRAEMYWSKMVYFYTVLSKEKGKEFFFNLMKDGAGYFLASKVWVPFLPPQRAFILYLCWEQSRLQGNNVVLQKLTDKEAVVDLQTHFFYLYKHAGHLKGQIDFEDYKKIFETIWQDRARNAGWNLDISYEDPECLKCVFRFTR